MLAAMLDAQSAGYHLAGYAAYELGYFFERRLAALAPRLKGPLLHFGIFDEPGRFDWGAVRGAGDLRDLSSVWKLEDYEARFRSVITYIRSGDVYQTNLTFPMVGAWSRNPVGLFSALRSRQPAPFGALALFRGPAVIDLRPPHERDCAAAGLAGREPSWAGYVSGCSGAADRAKQNRPPWPRLRRGQTDCPRSPSRRKRWGMRSAPVHLKCFNLRDFH